MRELHQDLWSVQADLWVVTTNGQVRSDGLAVMGRGSALQAAQRFPELPRLLARRLNQHGNHVYLFPEFRLATLPTKDDWRNPSDPALIVRSLQRLIRLVDREQFHTVAMPRPGCGNGGLTWAEVRPIVEPLLDDRFVIVS